MTQLFWFKLKKVGGDFIQVGGKKSWGAGSHWDLTLGEFNREVPAVIERLEFGGIKSWGIGSHWETWIWGNFIAGCRLSLSVLNLGELNIDVPVFIWETWIWWNFIMMCLLSLRDLNWGILVEYTSVNLQIMLNSTCLIANTCIHVYPVHPTWWRWQ